MQDSECNIDKTCLSVAGYFDHSDDVSYWLSKTPEERFAALELVRQVLYGYDATSAGLQRVLEVVGGARG